MSKMKHQLELRIERLAYDLADVHGHWTRLHQYEEKLWAIWSRNPDK